VKTNCILVIPKKLQMIRPSIFFKNDLYLLVLMMLALNSCQVGHPNRFNKQKFTNLKPISQEREPTVEESQDDLIPLDLKDDVNASDDVFLNPASTIQDNVVIKEYVEADFSISPEIDQPACDTIITASRTIICTIKKIDDKEITFGYCPENGNLFVIRKEDVKYYSGQPVEKTETISESNVPVEEDTLSQQEEPLPVVHTTEGEWVRHKTLGKNYFLRSLICLGVFGLGLVLFFLVGVEVLGLALVAFSFLIGYTFLAVAAYHSRIYKMLEPKKFANDSSAKAIHTLTILGMLLFGCFPFLIPFAIVWGIVRSESKKATKGRVGDAPEDVILQKSKRSNIALGIVLAFIFVGVLLTAIFL
jgi:hypothetical protein